MGQRPCELDLLRQRMAKVIGEELLRGMAVSPYQDQDRKAMGDNCIMTSIYLNKRRIGTIKDFSLRLSDTTTCAPEPCISLSPYDLWPVGVPPAKSEELNLSRARSGLPKISDKKIQKMINMRK